MTVLRFSLARAAWSIVLLPLTVLVSFVLIHSVPGSPLDAITGQVAAPAAYVAHLRHEYGLDQSIFDQFFIYAGHLIRGDLGYSYVNQRSVMGLIVPASGNTLILMVPSLVVACVAGVGAGILAGSREGSFPDLAVTTVTFVGYSTPVFWLGQILIVVFAVGIGVLPAQGMHSPTAATTGLGSVGDLIPHMILPVAVTGYFYFSIIARVARGSIIDAMSDDYVMTARSKGISEWRILWRHVLKNASGPIIAVIGFNLGYALTGAILVETVFGWPGVGHLFVVAISDRDYPVIEGVFIMAAVAVIAANLAADIVQRIVDPRVGR